MTASRKKLEWIGAARRELQAFPPLARRVAGMNLDLVQAGLDPEDCKPMQSVGPGARELRIRSFDGGTTQHRVIYVGKFPEALYVLHAFEKKTEQTAAQSGRRRCPVPATGREACFGRRTVEEMMEITDVEPAAGDIVEHVTPADGNIFADLGFAPEEAANLLIRSRLMIELIRIIRERGLKQKKTAALFGVSQPRISDLTRGRIGEFTIDSLVNKLAHAGMAVDVSVRPADPEAGATERPHAIAAGGAP